jgi:hypothetical protein
VASNIQLEPLSPLDQARDGLEAECGQYLPYSREHRNRFLMAVSLAINRFPPCVNGLIASVKSGPDDRPARFMPNARARLDDRRLRRGLGPRLEPQETTMKKSHPAGDLRGRPDPGTGCLGKICNRLLEGSYSS